MFLINDCFDEYPTAINGDLYGENVGALPGDFIILLCLCHGDLNGEQPLMGSSVSYLLNGVTITAFLFRLRKLSLLFFLTPETKFKYTLNPYSLTRFHKTSANSAKPDQILFYHLVALIRHVLLTILT